MAEFNRIIRHESGHWLIATLVGLTVHKIVINATEKGGCEISLDVPTPDIASLRIFLEKRCKVLIAGFLAEKVRDGQLDKNLHNGRPWHTKPCYAQDRAKYNELLFVLGNIDGHLAGPEHRQTIEDRLWAEVCAALVKHSATLDAISAVLRDAGFNSSVSTQAIADNPKVKATMVPA